MREPEGAEKTVATDEDEDEPQTQRSRGPVARGQEVQDIEGVFVVREGIAIFTPVEIGITGQEFFAVISGVEAGDVVVSGPYQLIRELLDQDPVQPIDDESNGDDESGPISFT